MTDRVAVEPAVLEWARTSSGLDQEGAAKKLGVSEASLAKWEAGELEPTIRQLRAAAKCYRRPLAVLLLPEPPDDFQALRDFRRVSGAKEGTWSPALHSEFKRSLSQREVFLELSELAPGAVTPSQNALELGDGLEVEEAAALLRGALGVADLSLDTSRPHEVLNAYIAAVEAVGPIVLQTRDVEIKEMRAFSVSEWPFPIIALNGKDWPRARLFSLLHELCHIGLNAGGLCDLHEAKKRTATEDEVEHYCNAVAGAVLMPTDAVLAHPDVRPLSAKLV